MFTRSQYAALLLAASLVATPVVADSTILLNSNRVVKHKVSSTVTPLTTVPNSKITHFTGLINAASSVSPVTTAVATQTAALEKNIVISTASTGEALPKAVPLRNATPGGISAPLKKKKKETSAAKRNLDTRAQTSNFNSTIVDSWLMVLSVGTPPQQLELSLDLGSDGFVVESTLVTPDMQTVDYPIYNPNTSTTGKQIDGYSWGVTYGGFSLEGVVFTDVVTLGENTWTNMTMEVVTAEPTGSPIESASGILGLAAHLITGANPAYVPSFLGSIMNQLSDVVFTIWFNSTDFTDGTDPDGSIDFGFIDETKYTGDIAYAPLYNAAATTFWSLNVSGIGAADPVTGDLLYSNMTGFTAILDTGDPQSQLPLAALWGYYGAIPGSIFDDGGYCWDYVCSVNTGLPDLVLFIDDKPIVVPRATYAWWENMNPSNGVPGVEYCTTHLRPSDYFNGGVNMIGQDIIEGIFLVLDWQNQQIGFANSTVRNTDSSFSIPGQGPTTSTTATSAASTSAASTPSSSTCSYTTSNVTINPFIKGCTGEEFGGTCYQIEVNNAGCTSLDSLNLTSIQPNEDSNLRCTFYSGTQCGTELSDAIDVMYPGVSALSQSPGSTFCISTGVEPATEEGALLAYCGDGVDIGSGCFLSGQNPWSCSIMFAPSDQFKFNMSYLYSWTAPVGNCFFFQDEYCATLVSNTTGVDMCTSDKIGNGYQTAVNFTSYVGSAMCI